MCGGDVHSEVITTGSLGRVLSCKFKVGGGDSTMKPEFITIIGRSWAADGTAFVIPELGIQCDAGHVVHNKTMPNVLVTHVHTDHAHFLTHLKSRSKPPMFAVPKESVTLAQKFLDASQQMSAHITDQEFSDFDWDKSYFFKGVVVGERIQLRKDLMADVLPCDHSVPCVGYRIVRVKQKLKQDYASLPSHEIGKLRKEGVEVTEQIEQPLLTFMGDTHASILNSQQAEKESQNDEDNDDVPVTKSPLALDAPIIIVECSFLTEDQKGQATKTRHVLWSELKPIVLSNPDKIFILIHFSHRFKPDDVRLFFENENIPNVIPWIEPPVTEDGTEPYMPDIYSHS